MSLARLALRLAAIEALCPSAAIAAGPWPTLAGPKVYDSRIDLIEGDETALAAIEGAPLVVVYTEQDALSPYGEAKYPAQESIVHLTIEIMIAALARVQVAAADGSIATIGTLGALGAPITDRQHEAMLDMLESQVRRVLGKPQGYDMPPSAALYNRIAFEVRHIESLPQRSADGATRYAARSVTLTVKIAGESWPTLDAAPSGIGLLPEPLRLVAMTLAPESTGYALCQSLIGLANPPPSRTPTQAIRMFLGLGETPRALDGADSSFQAAIVAPPVAFFYLGF